MPGKAPPSASQVDTRTPKALEENLVLRDESDALIDRLKARVQHLQHELARQRGADSASTPRPRDGKRGTSAARSIPAAGDGLPAKREDRTASSGRAASSASPPGTREGGGSWQNHMTRRLLSHLEKPAAELNDRLGRLVEVVQDPQVKQELDRCRRTASFILQTFRQVSEHQRNLGSGLQDSPRRVHIEAFAALLQNALRDSSSEKHTPSVAAPHCSAHLPRWIFVRHDSLASAVTNLGRLARHASTAPLTLRLEAGKSEAGEAQLRILLVSEEAWSHLPHKDVSSLAFRAEAGAGSAIDLLYAEKVIAISGGQLQFHRRQGLIHGLDVRLPLKAKRQVETVSSQPSSASPLSSS